ncbi:aminopeptidase N C-terminal domain-containing protein [Oceanimonas sp. NS1]|nr:aminopeptidase N C-terminal domain-containing protein [Oceanimonas sp. NS1]
MIGTETPVAHQYDAADNMTDTLGALRAAVRGELDCRHAMLADFERKWRDDGLVLDNWFRLQATAPGADTLGRVRELMSHPTFSLGNPNRVRALIGAFCRGIRPSSIVSTAAATICWWRYWNSLITATHRWRRGC